MLSKLNFIKNIKTYLIGGTLVLTLLFTGYNYTVYLNNKIDALVTDRETLSQIVSRYETTTKHLSKTLDDNNKMLLSEIDYLNKSFSTYQTILINNKQSIDDLSNYMSEMQNEQIKTCFNTELPDDLVERLFNITRTKTE